MAWTIVFSCTHIISHTHTGARTHLFLYIYIPSYLFTSIQSVWCKEFAKWKTYTRANTHTKRACGIMEKLSPSNYIELIEHEIQLNMYRIPTTHTHTTLSQWGRWWDRVTEWKCAKIHTHTQPKPVGTRAIICPYLCYIRVVFAFEQNGISAERNFHMVTKMSRKNIRRISSVSLIHHHRLILSAYLIWH